MAINPRKIKKVPPRPAKDLKKTDPKDLRNKALREANRAANENKPRYDKKIGPGRPQGPEAPRYDRKIGPSDKPAYDKKIGPKKPSIGATVAKGVLKRVAPAIGFIVDAAPAGAGSDKPSGPLMKGNAAAGGARRVAAGTYTKSYDKKPEVSKTTGAGRPEYPSSNKMKDSSSPLRKAGAGTYTKSYDVKTKKTSSTSTAATAAAASSKTTSKTVTVKKSSVGRQSRYERDALAMETRNRSGNRPKKSILSLFRKG